MSILLVVIVWIVCAIVAAGGFFANLQGDIREIYPASAAKHRRENLGASLGLGLACGPLALVVSVFATGFYQHGWRLWERP